MTDQEPIIGPMPLQDDGSSSSSGSSVAAEELQAALDAIQEFKDAVAQIESAVNGITGRGIGAKLNVFGERVSALIAIAIAERRAVAAVRNSLTGNSGIEPDWFTEEQRLA